MHYQIAISGNVGVGKSTLGPIIAEAIDAPWLSETDISSIFPHLIADQCAHSKLITQLTFPTIQIASVLSHFLAGNSLVVTERSLWDHALFFKYWKQRFRLDAESANLIQSLYQILRSHPIEYKVLTIFLRCDCSVVANRTVFRGKTYDSIFSAEVLGELHEIYENALLSSPPTIIGAYDVTSLNIKESVQVDAFINEVVKKIIT